MGGGQGNYFAALPARVPEGLLESVRAGAPEGLRWFHPDDLHLTLAFFGPDDRARVPAIRAILAQIPISQFEVTLGKLLLLPRPRRFSAISFELAEGREAIADLIAAWRSPLLEAAGCKPDERPPLPHLTIARPPRKHSGHPANTIKRWANDVVPPAPPIAILPPVLYGWSPDRPARQFRVIAPQG